MPCSNALKSSESVQFWKIPGKSPYLGGRCGMHAVEKQPMLSCNDCSRGRTEAMQKQNRLRNLTVPIEFHSEKKMHAHGEDSVHPVDRKYDGC